MNKEELVIKAFEIARQQYEAIGVNVNSVIQKLENINLSIHCWQTDDVGGFEHSSESLGGGLAVTGNYPGKASSIEEISVIN